MNEHQRNSVIARNEDLSGPNYDHRADCKCINCEIAKDECQKWSIGSDCRCQDCIEGNFEQAEYLEDR